MIPFNLNEQVLLIQIPKNGNLRLLCGNSKNFAGIAIFIEKWHFAENFIAFLNKCSIDANSFV